MYDGNVFIQGKNPGWLLALLIEAKGQAYVYFDGALHGSPNPAAIEWRIVMDDTMIFHSLRIGIMYIGSSTSPDTPNNVGNFQLSSTSDTESSDGLELKTDSDDRNEVYFDGTLVLVGCGKAKRDPTDPADLHAVSVGPNEEMPTTATGEKGPAWKAQDLYTSSYFAAKREFAEIVSSWTGDKAGWTVLSAEHAVIEPWQVIKPYDTTIHDIGDDPTNEDHWVSFPYRRPDGEEVVTEMDEWAAQVALTLSKWIAIHRPRRGKPWESDANTLLVLAGKKYVEPLREHGVFENGISRMMGDPNQGYKIPLRTRYLFKEIDASGIGEQMAWLSAAISRFDAALPDAANNEQHDLSEWTR